MNPDDRRPRVLFLSTGGTLGMRRGDPGPLAPSEIAADVLDYVRGLDADIAFDFEMLYNLDSSDIGPTHWDGIGTALAAKMNDYAGFVVLHGTDTMAFTASALSFMLVNLPRPVILTGAQRPLAYVRTDAPENLVRAALCAVMDVAEVGVFFGRRLFRGNRVTKTSIQSYEAFESPNHAPLIEMGVEVIRTALPRCAVGPFTLRPGFCQDVAVLQMVPGAHPRILEAAALSGQRGVLIRGFGSGNLPHTGWPEAIRAAVDAGVAVVLQSQCLRGKVNLESYVGGRAALDAGAMPASEMTYEAAVVKLMWLLGQGLSGEALRRAYRVDQAGEGAG